MVTLVSIIIITTPNILIVGINLDKMITNLKNCQAVDPTIRVMKPFSILYVLEMHEINLREDLQ